MDDKIYQFKITIDEVVQCIHQLPGDVDVRPGTILYRYEFDSFLTATFDLTLNSMDSHRSTRSLKTIRSFVGFLPLSDKFQPRRLTLNVKQFANQVTWHRAAAASALDRQLLGLLPVAACSDAAICGCPVSCPYTCCTWGELLEDFPSRAGRWCSRCLVGLCPDH